MSYRCHRRTTAAAILILFFAVLAALPRALYAEEAEGEALVAQSAVTGYLSGDVLDGVTVRIRPENSALSLCLKNDGKGSQNVVYNYNIGDSSRFYLEKADSESYYIRFFQEPSSTTPSDTVLDVDKTVGKGYDKDGAAIHEVDKSSENHQRWKLYRYSDRTYAIQNKQTGQWWTLGDTSNKDKNGNELHQSKTRLYWEFEVLSAPSGSKLVSATDYSSYTFDSPAGTQVTAMNWMSQLPGDLYLSGNCSVDP